MDEQFFNEARQEYAKAGIDTFEIYQLKYIEDTQRLFFEPFDRLTKAGLKVERKNYMPVYIAPLDDVTPIAFIAPVKRPSKKAEREAVLDKIYEKFNTDSPTDFKGHSLSVSDVVVIKEIGEKAKAYYVDNFGFSEVPEFLDAATTSGKRGMEMG